MIDPTKTAIFPEKKDLEPLRLQLALFDKIDLSTTRTLMDTCQWLFECVDRMDGAQSWWLTNASQEQLDKYMREFHGYSDEDMVRIKERSARVGEKIKAMLNPDAIPKAHYSISEISRITGRSHHMIMNYARTYKMRRNKKKKFKAKDAEKIIRILTKEK